MNKLKDFKTYEEQIKILKNKGLICDENSLNTLKYNNYYFLINRYKDCFIIPNVKPNRFKPNTRFDEIVALWHFDRELRSILLKNIIIIENSMKSIISYELTKSYGYDYLNENNYNTLNNDPIRHKQIKNLIDSIESTIDKGIKDSKYIAYYHENYDQIPLWVVINDLSLGLTIKLYQIMKEKDQNQVSSYFKIDNEQLDCFLKILNFYRNLSAHNQRVFDQTSTDSIKNTSYHYLLNLPHNNKGFSKGKNDIMALIIIFKIMLTPEDFYKFTNELDFILGEFDKKVSTINNDFLLEKMNLPKNWKDIKK